MSYFLLLALSLQREPVPSRAIPVTQLEHAQPDFEIKGWPSQHLLYDASGKYLAVAGCRGHALEVYDSAWNLKFASRDPRVEALRVKSIHRTREGFSWWLLSVPQTGPVDLQLIVTYWFDQWPGPKGIQKLYSVNGYAPHGPDLEYQTIDDVGLIDDKSGYISTRGGFATFDVATSRVDWQWQDVKLKEGFGIRHEFNTFIRWNGLFGINENPTALLDDRKQLALAEGDQISSGGEVAANPVSKKLLAENFYGWRAMSFPSGAITKVRGLPRAEMMSSAVSSPLILLGVYETDRGGTGYRGPTMDTVAFVDSMTMKVLATVRLCNYPEHEKGWLGSALALSPDGTKFAVAIDRDIRVYKVPRDVLDDLTKAGS